MDEYNKMCLVKVDENAPTVNLSKIKDSDHEGIN